MTTVARQLKILKQDRGQSVLEFLFLLPVILGFLLLMVRINTAIQMSIVDQQYARAQTTWLTFNSPFFPRLAVREKQMVQKKFNQIMLGVSENVAVTDGTPYNPEASIQNIARNRTLASVANDDPQSEPDPSSGGTRAKVRVRNTVSLCAAPAVINIQGTFQPILKLANFGQGQSPQGEAFNFPENARFDYCRSEVIHE